jgi:hypothetical protein
METLEEQISLFAEDALYSVQACRASRHPLPGSDEARAMTVGSGRQLSMLLEECSPLGAFSKILLESLHWTNSEEYCYVWGIWDTKFACSAFQLTALGQSTGDSGFLLWRTPDANDSWRPPLMDLENMTHKDTRWPLHCLSTQAAHPRLWPTPTVQDGANNAGPSQMERNSLSLNATFGGSLNPRFVCELMGFAADHTNLKDWGMLSSRSRRTRSLKGSRKSKKAPELGESKVSRV